MSGATSPELRSAGFPVCQFPALSSAEGSPTSCGSSGWKAARTGRQECLPYAPVAYRPFPLHLVRAEDSPRSEMSRRAVLGRLGAGALLALGAWPGVLRAEGQGGGGQFRFIAVNDTHCMSAECEGYLDGLVRQMKSEGADFCLHAGDLTEKGEKKYLGMAKDVFSGLRRPMYPVIGNHDYIGANDRRYYSQTFPMRLNYYFVHEGWQFVGLDTSEGLKYENTEIQASTFQWLDDYLWRLNKRKPTVIFTHFPMGVGVTYRPRNADALLERFLDFNLQAVFCGHFHGFTERFDGAVTLTTNRCCALKRGNHDGTTQKGYFVCETREGKVQRRFVEYKPGS